MARIFASDVVSDGLVAAYRETVLVAATSAPVYASQIRSALSASASNDMPVRPAMTVRTAGGSFENQNCSNAESPMSSGYTSRMSRSKRDGVRSPKPPGCVIAWNFVALGTLYVLSKRARIDSYVALGPSKSATVRMPSSSSAPSTWLTRDKSERMRPL